MHPITYDQNTYGILVEYHMVLVESLDSTNFVSYLQTLLLFIWKLSHMIDAKIKIAMKLFKSVRQKLRNNEELRQHIKWKANRLLRYL